MTKTVQQAQADVDEARIALQVASDQLRIATQQLRDAKQAEAEQRQRDARKAIDKARRDAKRLAERIGCEIELESDFESRAWFVSHPKLEGAADPYEGDHYAFDWPDVLRRVQGYEAALKG